MMFFTLQQYGVVLIDALDEMRAMEAVPMAKLRMTFP